MIYLDPSSTLASELAPVAHLSGRDLLVFSDTAAALAALQGPAEHLVLVLAIAVDDGTGLDSASGLEFVREARRIAHRQELPVLLALSGRDFSLAARALQDGVTEVFLAEDRSAIREMALRYLELPFVPELCGTALIVEDNPVFSTLIGDHCRDMGLAPVACTSVEEALALLATQDFQLAIIDIVLDGLQSGLALVRHIRALDGETGTLPILVVSGFKDAARRLEALRIGADDYLEKPFAAAELVWRLRRIAGQDAACPRPNGNDIDSIRHEWTDKGLSLREMEISAAIVRGLTDKQISAELAISFWTVRSHVGSIFTKLGVLNRRELLTRYLPGRQSG